MAGHTQGEREVAEQVPGHQHGDERARDDQVGDHHAAGPAGERDDGGQRVQIVAGQDGVGALQGQVGAVRTHGHAQVGGGQGRGVVHAVADQQHPAAVGLQRADPVDLVGREQAGMHLGDAGFLGEPGRGARVVAGQQHRRRARQRRQCGDRARGGGADPVDQRQNPGRDTVHDDDHCRPPGRLRLFDHRPGVLDAAADGDITDGRTSRRRVRGGRMSDLEKGPAGIEFGQELWAAHLHDVAVHRGPHSEAGRRAEVPGGGNGDAALAGRGQDGGGDRVLAGVFGRGGQAQQGVVVAYGRTGKEVDLGQTRRALGQGAGLVEGDDRGAGQPFHDDGRLDQHAVAAGQGDRGQQRRHRGQHDRARRGHDHEGHRAQQGRLQLGAEGERDREQGERGQDDAGRVALLDLFDEQLRLRLGGRGLFDQDDDPGQH